MLNIEACTVLLLGEAMIQPTFELNNSKNLNALNER